MTDEQLVTDIRAGNHDRFEQLYTAYVDRIHAFLFFRTNHRETAEDLTSTVFLKALDRIHQFGGGSFRAWLYTIARTTLIDHYRTNRPTEDIDAAHLTTNEDHDARVDLRLSLNKVRLALEKLSDEQREVVTLRVWDDLSYADIARILGKTEAACKMTFSRSVAQLKSLVPVLSLIALMKLTYAITA